MEKSKLLKKLESRKTMFEEYIRQVKTPLKKQEETKQPRRV